MAYKYDYIVYIGRFQPVHLAHIKIMKQALKEAGELIVLVGSANQPRTIKNPWAWHERAKMIKMSLTTPEASRVNVLPLRDILYNDQAWARQVQDVVEMNTNPESTIRIIGHSKDESSYYLEMFPQWGPTIDVGNIVDIHASDIRNALWTSEDEDDFDLAIGRNLPPTLHAYLKAFMLTDDYDQLVREHKFIEGYKRAWDWNATLDAFLENEGKELPSNATVEEVIHALRKSYTVAPYVPTFVTVDAVVVQSGHILLVRRRAEPGRGLWALPGGFINYNERVKSVVVRELIEETKIKVPEGVLKGKAEIDGNREVFDHPDRSLRGRTITHAFYIELASGKLPKVKGSDDADKAKWVPLSTFAKMEDQLFEDHFHIVNFFIGE